MREGRGATPREGELNIAELRREIASLKQKRTSQFYLGWLRFKRNKLAMVGLSFAMVIVFLAVFAPLIAPYGPFDTDAFRRLQSPSGQHLLGTDELGRDVLSRAIYGSRIALQVGLLIVLFEGTIGITFGVLSGYFGGRVDQVIMRFVDILRSFPVIILAMAIAGIMGQGLYNVVIAIGLVGWTTYARMVRSKVLSIKEADYVEAAYAVGESTPSVILRYIIPNVLPTAIIMVCIMMPTALIASATLSFLGVGVQPPAPCWGSMAAAGRDYIVRAPWISAFAGFFIMFTVLGFNFVGDGLRDAFDPTSKRN